MYVRSEPTYAIYHVSFLRQTKLVELNIASNRISSFETGFLNVLPKSLRILNIADNVLSFGIFIFEFSVLPNLEILNVSFQDSFHQVGMNGDFFENCNDTKVATCNYMNNNKYMYESNSASKSNTISLQGFSKPSANISFYLPRNLQKLYYHDNLYKMSIPEFPMGLNNSLIINAYIFTTKHHLRSDWPNNRIEARSLRRFFRKFLQIYCQVFLHSFCWIGDLKSF